MRAPLKQWAAKTVSRGPSDALGALLESSSEIIEGRNPTVEHFANRGKRRGEIRLSFYSALVRKYLYKSEKNALVIHVIYSTCTKYI